MTAAGGGELTLSPALCRVSGDGFGGCSDGSRSGMATQEPLSFSTAERGPMLSVQERLGSSPPPHPEVSHLALGACYLLQATPEPQPARNKAVGVFWPLQKPLVRVCGPH